MSGVFAEVARVRSPSLDSVSLDLLMDPSQLNLLLGASGLCKKHNCSATPALPCSASFRPKLRRQGIFLRHLGLLSQIPCTQTKTIGKYKVLEGLENTVKKTQVMI